MMFPKDEELNKDILADEGGFIAEDGSVRSVENGKLTNFLHANQPDDLSKGKSSSSIKKFFDYIAIHVILPWLRALTEKINALTDRLNVVVSSKAIEALKEAAGKGRIVAVPDNIVSAHTANCIGHVLAVVGGDENTKFIILEESTDRLFFGSAADVMNAAADLESELRLVFDKQTVTIGDFLLINMILNEANVFSKVSVSDIINNLTTNVGDKPLSAEQGVVLKALIDTLTEKINAIPAWAKEAARPSYTAEEVGADPAGAASEMVGTHNVSNEAHNDLRLLIRTLTDRLNAVANSDDVDLDQMKELVEYIKSNRSLIESVTTSKVSVTDIIDNLSTNVGNKPLSAAQGVALKALIDALSAGKLDADKLQGILNEALEMKVDKLLLRTQNLSVENEAVSYTLQNSQEKVLLYPRWSESTGADAMYIYINDVEYECFHSDLRVHTLPEDLYTYEHWSAGDGGTTDEEEIKNLWKAGAVIRAERVTAATVQLQDDYVKQSELPALKQEIVDAVLAALPTWEGGSY